LYFPSTYEADLYLALAQAATELADRIIICGNGGFDPDAFHREIWRDVARGGVRNRAIYVVSHLGLVREKLLEQIERDGEAGVDVRIISANALPENLARFGITETVLLNGTLAATAPRADIRESGRALWTITVGDEHVDELVSVFTALWQLGSPPRSLPDQLDLEEPLVQSAQLIDQVSGVLCAGDHVDREGCNWYHGTWQYLRLMDLVSTPSWHHDFYENAIEAAVRNGASRICVTGTADYSVLAYVMAAVERAQVQATVTVIDLCSTPLFACNWYAKFVGTQVKVHARDITDVGRDVSLAGAFDLVVTDAFLTRFTHGERAIVLAAWHHLLVSGGRIITTVRAHSEADRGQSSEEAIGAFRDRAAARWRRWESFIPITAAQIADRSENYARRMVSNVIGGQSEVLDELSVSFDVERVELASVPGELFPTRYARVILKRKEDMK
jgi:hypothetical protein